jgi:hypothetical protein
MLGLGNETSANQPHSKSSHRRPDWNDPIQRKSIA